MDWAIDSLILSPFSLISLLALFLPVLIHLFNPAKGRIVYVGNIALLKKLKPSKKLALRLNQWLLLLIRLVIIFLACLLLMQLLFALPVEKQKRSKVFVDLNWIEYASEKDKSNLFLNHSQSDIHLLDRNFPNLTPQSINNIKEPNNLQNANKNTAPFLATVNRQAFDSKAISEFSLNLWVREIEQQLALDSKVTIYTTNQQNRLMSSDKLVEVSSDLNWEILTIDSEKYAPSSQQIFLYYSASHQKDMEYVKIAIETLSSIATLDINLTLVSIEDLRQSDFKTNETADDWIFWLSDAPVAKQILRQAALGANLLVDIFNLEPINTSHQESQASTQKTNKTLTRINGTTFEFLTKAVTSSNTDSGGTKLWKTIEGNSLLKIQSLEKGSLFSLNSRFHPRWTSMVDSTKFPTILAGLLSRTSSDASWKTIDKNLIDQRFVKPVADSTDGETLPKTVDYQSKNSLVILLLCTFWLLERSLCRWRLLQDD